MKLRRNGSNTVQEWHATLGGMHVTEKYSVRFLGRGLWRVRRDDGYEWTLSSSAIQRFFSGWVSDDPTHYEEEFYTVE